MTRRRCSAMSSECSATTRETSYGGVVIKGDQVLAIVPRGKRALALPKGGGEAGESGEQAALREVREETGIEATVREPLGDVSYWYSFRGRRIFKIVHFYLCDYVTGEPAGDPAEVDEARWVPLGDAGRAFSYPGDREMVERATRRLAQTPRNL